GTADELYLDYPLGHMGQIEDAVGSMAECTIAEEPFKIWAAPIKSKVLDILYKDKINYKYIIPSFFSFTATSHIGAATYNIIFMIFESAPSSTKSKDNLLFLHIYNLFTFSVTFTKLLILLGGLEVFFYMKTVILVRSYNGMILNSRYENNKHVMLEYDKN
ncbi:hypothetical protein ACJX0J_009610, partial [Zea mays]